MLELYHHSTSVCAAKVRLVLEEKELAWEGRYVDIIAGEQFRPEFIRINPKAVVPVLVHDGVPVRESTVINEYLDDAFPDRPVRPDAMSRARMRLWTKVVDEGLHLACGTITFVNLHRFTILKMAPAELETFLASTHDLLWRERKRNWVLRGIDAPDVQDAIRLYDRVLADMDQALSGHFWLAGDEYSLADVALTPYVNRIDMLNFRPMIDERPHLKEWFRRIKARPNFARAVRLWIPDHMAEAMKQHGSENWPRIREVLQAA